MKAENVSPEPVCPPQTEAELFAAYQASGSAEFYERILGRYSPLVYRTCLRVLRDPGLAEDATQATFLVFLRRAQSLPRATVLSGWLHRTAQLAARNLLRSRERRMRNERNAASHAQAQPHSEWEAVKPHIDEAIASLPSALRDAVVTRYFRGLSEPEAARELGVVAGTLHMRVYRGIDKLRAELKKKGVLTASSLSLAECLLQNTSDPVPAQLAASLAGASGTQSSAAIAELAATTSRSLESGFRVKALVVLAGAALVTAGVLAQLTSRNTVAGSVPDQIRAQATLVSTETNNPLPLAGHWNTGIDGRGFSPDWQMAMIDKGHLLLPWFQMPAPKPSDPACFSYEVQDPSYYESAIRKAAALKLPISFVGTHWEYLLTDDPAFYNLPSELNPNALDSHDVATKVLDPLGPPEPWRQAGRMWVETAAFKKLQALYPDPPAVLLISTNEPKKLGWMQLEQSRRYLARYGTGRDEEFKRTVASNGWQVLYRAMLSGMREGLSSGWRKHAKFVGFGATGPEFFGRWDGWTEYALHTASALECWSGSLDGGSARYYVHFNANRAEPIIGTDYKIFSPQIEAMNQVFMKSAALKVNPEYWYEMSVWDGNNPRGTPTKREYYASLGQHYGPERYAGMVQFGMWLLRPRVVREFRYHFETQDAMWPYFEAVLSAVERVHRNPALADFWREGQLLAQPAGAHPYQARVPDQFKNEERWFLLEASANQRQPIDLSTELKVFALALVRGVAPARKFLVYAHAPLGQQLGVTIQVPGYGSISSAVPVRGTFILIDEKNRSVTKVD